MNPRSRRLHVLRRLPQRLLTVTAPAEGNRLYLSFDDGPNPSCTPSLLDLLAAHGARASFFLLGAHAEKHPDIVRRMVREGHLIGNHTWSHPAFNEIPQAERVREIDRTDCLLAEFDGRARHRFRPPNGALSVRFLLHFARTRRSVCYWSYDSMDYRPQSVADLCGNLRGMPPRAGDVVLMHDDEERTVKALACMLPEWLDAGFTLAALPEEDVTEPKADPRRTPGVTP